MVKRQLVWADGFFPGYCSGMGMFVNTWRGAQNGKKIAAVWKVRCPETRDCCRKLPPGPLRGRWGSISDCEKWLLDVKRREPALPDIFEEALVPTLARRPRANHVAVQVESDCPEGDEAAHRAKVIFKLFFYQQRLPLSGLLLFSKKFSTATTTGRALDQGFAFCAELSRILDDDSHPEPLQTTN